MHLKIPARHRLDDGLDALGERFFSHDVHVGPGGGLVSRHRGGFVVEDDVGDVLAGLDGVRDRDHPRVEKRGVAQKNNLLVRDERVGPRARSAAQPHPGIVMHERFIGLKHQHGKAAGLAVKDEVNRLLVVRAAHIDGVQKILFDLQKHRRGVAMRASGAERGRPDRQFDLGLGRGFKYRLLGGELGPIGLRQGGFTLLEERDQPLQKDGCVEPPRLGHAGQAMGKFLSP